MSAYRSLGIGPRNLRPHTGIFRIYPAGLWEGEGLTYIAEMQAAVLMYKLFGPVTDDLDEVAEVVG